MNEIDEIRSAIAIYDLAVRYGAEPQREDANGAIKCNVNPLRYEKTSSLFIYTSTNSWFDFGSKEGGSIIDWIMIADSVSPSDAIFMIREMSGTETIKPVKKYEPVEKEYQLDSSAVEKIFTRFKPISAKTHRDELLSIAPEWLFKQTKSEDLKDFGSLVRYDEQSNTAVLLVKDGDKPCSIRHRRMNRMGEIKKWYALKGTKANVPYIRDNKDELLLVVEGSHDYLTAILAGYSVIALPSSGYKLDPIHVLNRQCLFIADDDEAGREGMTKTIAHCGGEGILFDHNKFRLDNQLLTQPKDFSEYVEAFTSLRDLQVAIALHVETIHERKTSTYDEMLSELNEHVTDDLINSLGEIEMMIDGILPRGQITTLVGKPNVGKSAITFAFINKLLDSNMCDGMIYFDADNPLMYSAERIKKLKQTHQDKQLFYYSGSSTTKQRMSEILTMLSSRHGGGDRVIMVVDSLKNFVNGSINDDKIINPMFDMLQQIRDRFGATIILLHHTKKGKDEDGKLVYVGSQVIEASTDNMITVSRDENVVILEPTKMRSMLSSKAYDLDFENMQIVETEAPSEVEDPTVNASEIIYAYLLEHGSSSESAIAKALAGTLSKSTVKKTVFDDQYKNHLWKLSKGETRGWNFTPIRKDPEQTVYEMPTTLEAW